jgi:hypothetical protein
LFPQNCVFLLLCPSNAHKLWYGAAFPTHEAGVEFNSAKEDAPSVENILKWAAKVLPGDVRVENAAGSSLLTNSEVSVEMYVLLY